MRVQLKTDNAIIRKLKNTGLDKVHTKDVTIFSPMAVHYAGDSHNTPDTLRQEVVWIVVFLRLAE